MDTRKAIGKGTGTAPGLPHPVSAWGPALVAGGSFATLACLLTGVDMIQLLTLKGTAEWSSPKPSFFPPWSEVFQLDH